MPTNSTVNHVRSRDGTIAFDRTGSGQAIALVSPALADRSVYAPLAEPRPEEFIAG